VPGRRHLRRSALLLAVGAVATALGLAAYWTGVLDPTERAATDARFAIRGPQAPPRDVVIVGVDAQTLQSLDLVPPLPRSLHARMLDRLREAGARAIAYDFVFAQPTTAAQDNALIRAVIRTPRLVLAATKVDDKGRPDVLGGSHNVLVGSANFGVTQDRVIRRVPRLDLGLPSFAAASAQVALGHAVDPARFPSAGALIDYAGPPGTVETLSFSDVLDGRDADRLRGRVVVVGATDPLLHDIQETPVGGGMPGPEVQANAIATILRDFPLRDAAGWAAALLIALAGLATPSSALVLSGLRWLPVPVVLLTVGAVGIQLAFDAGVVLPVAASGLTLLVAFLGTLGVIYATDLLDRRRLRTAFARFVPPEVVDEVVAQTGEEMRLGGTRRDGTVLFCDLRGFTSKAERMEVEQVIEMLNRYLAEMSDAILDHGGTVVSYMGDGIMAVFGAPLPQDDHADRALAAAREMLGERLERFGAWAREAGLPGEMAMGIGVCSGPVMSGNVGSQRRLEYTAGGDTTNTAARLQAATREAGRALLVSDATRSALHDSPPDLVSAGTLRLRGRETPVVVWTLHDDGGPGEMPGPPPSGHP
jgi:adenylate cyclase